MKNIKHATAFALSAILLSSALGLGVSAEEQTLSPAADTAVTAVASITPRHGAPVSVTLDGVRILDGEAQIIGSTTYVPLRRFCDAVGWCSIQWNAGTRTATVSTGSLSITARQNALYIVANGRCLYTVDKILNLDGTLWVPIRPLAKAYGMELSWDGDSRTVRLSSTGKVISSGDSFYRSDDVLWLARIIQAEAGGEPFLGKIAVGNVVLNRVASPQYPNTIWGVIFDRKHGTQFSPVSFGTIYNNPSEESIIAAKICLEGYSLSSKALFFMNPRIATTSWIADNRPYLFTIGQHDFYA
ncbi:MAG: cell wall hydrolase [Clostridia bacterium]|nr:cell wall hydrolase [Clostridia bacterium]